MFVEIGSDTPIPQSMFIEKELQNVRTSESSGVSKFLFLPTSLTYFECDSSSKSKPGDTGGPRLQFLWLDPLCSGLFLYGPL